MGDFFSGKNIAVKIILVVITIVVLLAVSFFTIMDGIVNLVFSFFKDMGDIIINVAEKYLEEMILQKPFGGDLKFYKIDETAVNSLKSELENSGIDTETCGLTQIRLRKILLAQAVSTSFDQTLCMATVTEQEILENVKQKDEYKNIGSLQDFLNKPVKTEESKNLWPDVENLTNYTLYYDSDKFFYFQDTDNRFENGTNQWYLGAMGAITLTKEDGSNMVYGTAESFNEQKNDFLAAKETWINSDDDFSEEELLNIYTDGDSPNEIRVWNIITKQKMYDYTFKNDENGIEIEKKGKDKEYTYEIKEQVINVQDKLDASSFTISIELMIDLLDMSSSGEFLETFIDYALKDLKVSAKVFQTSETQITYSKEKFNIPNGFIIEVYDLIDIGDGNATDLGDDNFRAYADIVYKRTYQGLPFESVAKLLEDKGEIDYDGEFKETVTINAATVKQYFGDLGETAWNLVEQVVNFVGEASEKSALLTTIKTELQELITKNEDTLNLLGSLLGIASDKVEGMLGGLIDSVFDGRGFSYDTYYQVGPLSQYLKTAYDPGAGFTLGNIEVEEKTRTRILETSCDMAPSKIETWYGVLEYSEPTILNNYFLSVAGGEEVKVAQDEYNNYGYSKLEEDTSVAASEQMERIYASNSIAVQYHKKYGNDMGKDGKKVEVYSYAAGGTDLTDEVFKRKPGYNNKEHYDAWTANGLFEIGAIDKGTYNRNLGASTGSDYIYLKYKKDNIKKYKDGTKIKRNTLDTSSVTRTVANNDMEQKLRDFLELLKNDTGNIPTSVGSEGGFKQDGKVVMYGDIYKGQIPAGDLLLDNGALMLFELLETNENTQELVNIFKYLAYLYTGTDYGITSVSDIGYIFNLTGMSGIYGGSVEEKIWFTLKGLGLSDYAVAGAMGNFYAESGFKTNNLEGAFESILGYTDETYTEAVNNGTYTRNQFISDHTSDNCGAGYGLAQWTYYTRKAGLYDYCKDKGVSIDDEDAQIEFLVAEITGTGPAAAYADKVLQNRNGYTEEDWKNATSAETAAEAFCWVFENPGTPHMETRKNMASTYLQKYEGQTATVSGEYNGTFLQIAEECHEYLRINNYYYSSASHKQAGGCTCGGSNCGSSTGSAIPKPVKGEGNWVDCSSYVCWVLYEYGYKDYFEGWQKVAKHFIDNKSYFETAYGWVYKDAKNAVAGDIVVKNGHMEIYAGNGDFYNAGCTAAIRKHHSDSGDGYLSRFTYAITIPAR